MVAEDEGFDLIKVLSPSSWRFFILYYDPYRLQSTSIRMRLAINGFSHGLKIARPLSIFTPVRALVPPFRILSHPLPIRKATLLGGSKSVRMRDSFAFLPQGAKIKVATSVCTGGSRCPPGICILHLRIPIR